MAEIDEYLSKIATGVYGRDIRKAIYDGIKLIYDTKSVSIRAMTKSQYDALPEYDSNTLYCIVGEDFVPKLGYDVFGTKYDIQTPTITTDIVTTAESSVIVAVMHSTDSGITVSLDSTEMERIAYEETIPSTLDGRTITFYRADAVSRGNYTVSVSQENQTEMISMSVIADYQAVSGCTIGVTNIAHWPTQWRMGHEGMEGFRTYLFFVSDNVFIGSDKPQVYVSEGASVIQQSITTPRFQMYAGEDTNISDAVFNTRSGSYEFGETLWYAITVRKEVSD